MLISFRGQGQGAQQSTQQPQQQQAQVPSMPGGGQGMNNIGQAIGMAGNAANTIGSVYNLAQQLGGANRRRTQPYQLQIGQRR